MDDREMTEESKPRRPVGWINVLFRRDFFPWGLQALVLAAFALLVVGGLLADTDDPAFAKVLRNTNLANLLVWSYWWPLIIISAILFGRVWCMVCPMELLTALAARIGLKRRPPRVLRSGWGITIFYVLILFVGIHTLAIHRVPFRMALYLLMLLAAAVVTGLLFEKNTFCASLCPVGHLLGLYARLAPFGWGVRDKSLCRSCGDRSCVAEENQYRFQGRSCGVGLLPSAVDDNAGCLLCGQCLKACARGNPGVEGRPNPGWFRRPWAADLLALKSLTGAQAAFLLIVSGFVIYEVLTEWNVTKGILLYTPTLVQSWLPGDAWPAGLTKCVTLFLVLPLVIWGLPFVLFRLFGGRMAFARYACALGIAFIPIMAAAHVTKSLLKMASRVPYWEWSLSDPLGVSTAHGILDETITRGSPPSWFHPALTVAALLMLIGGVALSIVLVRKLIAARCAASPRAALAFYLIPAIYGGIFLGTMVAWRLV